MRRATLFLALFLAADARAQDARPVTIGEAIRTALEQSPEVRRAETADASAELAVSAARAGRLPTLSASLTPSQRYGLSFDQTTGSLASQTVEQLNVGLSASVPLYDGGRTRAAVAQARLEREATSVGAERTEQRVAVDVAQQFLQLLLDRELVDVQQAQLAAAVRQLDQVRNLVDGGARPRADVIAQEAVVAERRSAVVSAEGAVARDEAILIQLVGLDPLGDYAFVGPDLDALEAAGALDGTPPPLAALLDQARLSRSDRRALGLRLEAAQAAEAVARAAGRPQVDVSAFFGTGYSSLQQRLANPDAPPISVPVTLADGTPVLLGGVPLTFPAGDRTFEPTPIFSQFGDNRSGQLSVTLSVPLFDAYRTRRSVAEARIRATGLELDRLALDRQLAAEVQQARVEATTARAQLDAAEVQVTAAAAALAVEQDRYALGAGTLYDVAQAQARLAQAQASRAQAAYGLLFRAALVRLAVGDVTPADLAADLLGRP